MITPPIGTIDATDLGVAVAQISYNSNDGSWSILGYWNYAAGIWESTFVVANHLRKLKRTTANQSDINYKLMLWTVPPEPLGAPNTVAILYHLDVNGNPVEVADSWNNQLLNNFLGYAQ